jgi:hypothetical protein
MAIQLKMEGKLFSMARPKPTVVALQKFLDAAPADEIFTPSLLAPAVKINFKTLTSGDLHGAPELQPYTSRVGNYRYWGNPKAIAELRRQVGQ